MPKHATDNPLFSQPLTVDGRTSAAPVLTPPSTAGMTTKVVKGSLWTLAGQVLPLGVSLVTTPFTIRMLGAEGYGVLILVGLIPTYLGFADFGMSMASTKFGSEAYAEGDEEKEGRIVRTAALIALFTSVPIAALLMFFAGQIVGLFNVPPELTADAILALRLASVTLVTNFLCSIFNTPQLARLRMDLNTVINVLPRSIGLITIPIVIYLGYGIVGAVSVLLTASLFTLLGHIYVSGRLTQGLFKLSIDRRAARLMLGVGGALAISGVAAVLLVNLEKLVLPAVTTSSQLAYYSVAFTFASGAAMYSLAMGQALMPTFSRLLLPEKRAELESIYARAFRYNIFGILPILALLCVIGSPFIVAWAGEDFGRESSVPFYVLLIGLFFNLNAYIPAGLLQAAGRTDVIAKLYWIQLVPYIAITVYLTGRFGAIGAAVSWSLRVIVDAIVYFVLANKVVGVRTDFGNYRLGFVFGILALSFPITFSLFFSFDLVWLVAFFMLALAVYALILWRRAMDSDERIWLLARLTTRARG